MTDARIRMLEIFGNEALAWTIDAIELVVQQDAPTEFYQPQLDFREPVKVRKHHVFDRGKVR